MIYRATMQKVMFLSVLYCFIFPQMAYAGQAVDPAQVKKVMEIEKGTLAEEEKDGKKLITERAKAETQQLGGDNKEWNESNPDWKPIYKRVHSDLERDMPKILAAQKELAHDYVADLASRIKQQDIDAVLAYYHTPEGQDYLKFSQQMDRLSAAALKSLKKRSAQAPKPTKEQMNHNYQLMALSRLGRGMVASMESDKASHRDISGYGDVFGMFIMAPLINSQESELESLYSQYQNELPAFEAFTKKDTSQHYFVAEFKANNVLMKNSRAYIADLKDYNVHKKEWRKLYQNKDVAPQNSPSATVK